MRVRVICISVWALAFVVCTPALVAAVPERKADAPAAPAAVSPTETACLESPEDPKVSAQRSACLAEKSPGLCLYRLARTLYEKERWADAAPLFWEVTAIVGPVNLCQYAANLFIDCLQQLTDQAKSPRPSCQEEITIALPVLEQRLCNPGSAETADYCKEIARFKKAKMGCVGLIFPH